MKTQRLTLLSIFLFACIGIIRADKYKEHAEEIRKSVWAWENAAFHNYTVPEEYKHASVVALARHQQIEATSKNRFRMNALLFGDINRELYYTKIDRLMIKLNDQKSLEEYSELSFQEMHKVSGFLRSNVMKMVVGARIIKPDGTIHEVAVDDDVVSVTEGKKDKEAFKKLAVKGLEVGDILDYFYCEEMELETYNVPSQNFAFYSEYPTLSYSVQCVLGKKLTVEHASINGAPDFVVSQDEDENTILFAEQKNLKDVGALDDVRWFSAFRDLPIIRLLILNNGSKLVYKPENARKNGVYKNVSYEDILKDAKGDQAMWYNRTKGYMGTFKKIKPLLANYKQKNPTAGNEEIALFLYDALRFYWPNDANYLPDYTFIVIFEKMLRDNGVECKLGFVPSRLGPAKKDVVVSDDLLTFVTANNNKQYFFYPNGYHAAGFLPTLVEGEPASCVSVVKYNIKSKEGIEGPVSEFTLPISSYTDNKNVMHSQITLSDDNPLKLVVNRQVSVSGELKGDYQRILVLYEEWDKLIRKRLLIEQDFWQEMDENKQSRKYIDQYKVYFEDKRTEQKEVMIEEFKEFHNVSSGELIDYTIKELGAFTDKPVLEYEINYSIEGIAKKAGEDIILDVGKLIGRQWMPAEKERTRMFNAYINSACMFDDVIVINIPNHYSVEGLEKLNMAIENEYGTFSSSAVWEDNKLKIVTSKIYKTNFVEQANWAELLKITDQANSFFSESVLLKKVN